MYAVALLGLPRTSFLVRRRDDIERAARSAHAKLALAPGLPVQKTYYDEFRKALYGRRQAAIFERRLSGAFASLLSPLPVIDWQPPGTFLSFAPMHAAVTVIKTRANSWTMSARYHDDKIVHCVFGCAGAPDDLAHYLACGPLWSTVTAVTRVPFPDDVLERLCIRCPNRGNLRNLLVVSGTYHTMKHQYLEEVRSAGASSNWECVLELASSIATSLGRDWASIDPMAVGRLLRAVATPAPEIVPLVLQSPTACSDYCEPECSDMPNGMHHPFCAVYLLAIDEKNVSPAH